MFKKHNTHTQTHMHYVYNTVLSGLISAGEAPASKIRNEKGYGNVAAQIQNSTESSNVT